MPKFRTGTVTAITSEREGLQRVEVDGRAAYVLTNVIGPVAAGDRVVVNTTAVDLGLGTGGADVVHWNLSRDEWDSGPRGREMKVRYTSVQVDVDVSSNTAPATGRPVIACFLHSQVACIAAAFKHAAPMRSLAYVMTDGGALPIAISDVVADLRQRGLIDATITAGHAFGGDREAVNVPHAIELALDHDAVVVGMGPGSLGTDSRLGYSGLEVATVIDTASALGCQPVVAVRYSDADARTRHRGVSHHTRTALEFAATKAIVPIPAGEPDPGLPGMAAAVDVPALDVAVTSMGRTAADDPKFFAYAAAAGVAAAQALSDAGEIR